MTNYLGADYGKHRRTDAQALCDSAGSSDTAHHRATPLIITGNKTRDAALGEPRIRAGEIIGWRIWKLPGGLLQSVIVPYTWRPGVYDRSRSRWPRCYEYNVGYHAFRDKEQAERAAWAYIDWSPIVIGSVAMWGEVIEHEYGWRSEYAAIRSIVKIFGNSRFMNTQLLTDLREKYGCAGVTEPYEC